MEAQHAAPDQPVFDVVASVSFTAFGNVTGLPAVEPAAALDRRGPARRRAAHRRAVAGGRGCSRSARSWKRRAPGPRAGRRSWLRAEALRARRQGAARACETAPPNVCIIGAGVSGLTACKALDDFGVPHTCFEASDEVGGNWYFQNPNGVSSAYRSLHIDISKPSISFRDFPMPDRYPDYPHHTHIFEWLCDYADAFDVRRNIRFNTRVTRAERGPQGGWTITLDDGSTAALRRAARLQRPPLGPAHAVVPGHLRRAAAPLARLRRPERPARPEGQARARRRDRQQRRGHRLRARPQDGLRDGLPLDALGRLRGARSTCSASPPTRSSRPTR